MEIRKSPESSNIAQAEYSKADKALFITFKNGGRYKYSDVPEEAWLAYKGAESVGKFFYKYIKGKFDDERTTNPQD